MNQKCEGGAPLPGNTPDESSNTGTLPQNTDNTNHLRDAALRLADDGFPVFACKSGDKAPATRNGYKDASVDAECIEKWWRRHRDANIGIATAGLLVVDLDQAKGDKPGGMDWYNALTDAQRADFEAAPLALTPSGGRHYYLRAPEGVTVKSRAAPFAPGVDIRGGGGYVVCPPSIRADGTPYQWAPGRELIPRDRLPIAPPWLVELATAKRKRHTARPSANGSAGAFELPESIPEGARNDLMFRHACALRARGAELEAIRAALTDANAAHCRPPLEAPELDKITESALRYEPGDVDEGPLLIVEEEGPGGELCDVLDARRTPAKTTLTVEIRESEDAAPFPFTFSTTETGLKDFARAASETFGGDVAEWRTWARAELWSAADEALAEKQRREQRRREREGDAPRVFDAALAYFKKRLRLSFREHDGSAWCEDQGRPVKASSLATMGGKALLELVARCGDGEATDAKNAVAISKLTPALWSDLAAALPDETAAAGDLGPDSRAADRRRTQLLKLFHRRDRWPNAESIVSQLRSARFTDEWRGGFSSNSEAISGERGLFHRKGEDGRRLCFALEFMTGETFVPAFPSSLEALHAMLAGYGMAMSALVEPVEGIPALELHPDFVGLLVTVTAYRVKKSKEA